MKNFISVFMMFIACSATASIDEPLEISSGKITGLTLDSGTQAFLGIPYAAAPVGDLRWKAPRAPIP